jgi:hypothetical protein
MVKYSTGAQLRVVTLWGITFDLNSPKDTGRCRDQQRGAGISAQRLMQQLGHGHRVPTHPQFKEPQFMNVRIDGLFSVYLTEKLPGSSRKVQRVRG